MDYHIKDNEPLNIMGILNYSWGDMWDRQVIVVRNPQGVLSLASVSWLKEVCDAGRQVEGISFSRDGNVFFDMGEANLPIYTEENNKIIRVNHGAAFVVAYGTGSMNGSLLLIDGAGQLFMSTISRWNEMVEQLSIINHVGKYDYYPKSYWQRDIERTQFINKKVLKTLWSFNNNNGISDLGNDKRRTVYLLSVIYGPDSNKGCDREIGFKVLTPDLKVKYISNYEMQKALFVNASVQDGYNRMTKLGVIDTVAGRIGKIYTKIPFESINHPNINNAPIGDCRSCGINTDLAAIYRSHNAKYFNNELPQCVKLEWNTRLTRTAGWCSNHDRVISISTEYADRFPVDIGNVMLHEMIHLRERNHSDGFKAEMDRIHRLGGNVSLYSKGRAKLPKYTVKCVGCGNEFQRDRLVSSRALCAKCRCDEFVYKINDDYTSPHAGQFISRSMVEYLR